MQFDDILRLPNLRAFSDLEVRMIGRLFHDFPYMNFQYEWTTYPPNDPHTLSFLRKGVLGLAFGADATSSWTLVAKLSDGRGFFGGERIGFHLFDSFGRDTGELDEIGTWKMLSPLLVKIANADHYPQ